MLVLLLFGREATCYMLVLVTIGGEATQRHLLDLGPDKEQNKLQSGIFGESEEVGWVGWYTAAGTLLYHVSLKYQ